MAGIIIPGDRTTKQPGRGYCLNPACKENSLQARFEFDVHDDGFSCPKCGANAPPMVGLLVLVHHLIPNPGKDGPLYGEGNLPYRLGCDETRAYLATWTNMEAATGELASVNCPGCLAAAEKTKTPRRFGAAIIGGTST